MLIGKQFTGSRQARLHFIEDQQDTLLVAKLTQLTDIVEVYFEHAAFSLDRFQHHRAGPAVNRRL